MTSHDDLNHDSPPVSPLSDADARAVDAVLAQRTGDTPPAAPDLARLVRAQALFDLIGQCPAADPPLDLIHRTLQRVGKVRQVGRAVAERTLRIAAPAMPWGEVGVIAAIIIIGISLAVPALSRARESERRAACQENLHQAGAALASYADDYAGLMPRRRTEPNANWWRVGQPASEQTPSESNSAHLYLLARHGYIKSSDLACPDNAQAQRHLAASASDWPTAEAVSYSYQNQYTPQSVRLGNSPSMAVLADKNPLFQIQQDRGLTYRKDLPAETPSRFHAGRGQNILGADGRAMWAGQPVLPNGDNIWLIRGVSSYKGNESPQQSDDSFLVP